MFLKCENLQRAGSFKIRGAYTRMARLSDEEKARGVVAASAGNHAQGVALAAQLLGIRSTVFMPLGRAAAQAAWPPGRTARTSSRSGATSTTAWSRAREFAAETGAVLIHPFDHPDIVAGQGTCGLEILEQCPDVRTILVSGGRRRADGRHRHRREGQAAGRAGGRRPGRDGGGLPGVAGRRRARAAGLDEHDGRRHRGGAARRGALRDRARARGRRRRRSARRACRGPCCSCSSGPSWSSSRPAPPPWRTCSTPASGAYDGPGGGGAQRRQHRPDAAAADHPPRDGRGRALPAVPGPRARQPGVPGPAAGRPGRGRRQRAGGRARPHRRHAAGRRGRDRGAAGDQGRAALRGACWRTLRGKGYDLVFA